MINPIYNLNLNTAIRMLKFEAGTELNGIGSVQITRYIVEEFEQRLSPKRLMFVNKYLDKLIFVIQNYCSPFCMYGELVSLYTCLMHT